MSVMPMEASLSRRVEWDMVSKAALRSRRMRMDNSLESAAIRRSFVILRRAVSVLWQGAKTGLELFVEVIVGEMSMDL